MTEEAEKMTLVKRIVAEYSETCEAPSDFAEVKEHVTTILAIIRWCRLPIPTPAVACVLFLQRTRFSWDIMADSMRIFGIHFEDNWQVPHKNELFMPPTTGFENLIVAFQEKVVNI